MLVKELIEKLKTCDQDANVCVGGNGKGASPFIDLDDPEYAADDGISIYETEDCEWGCRNNLPAPTLQCGCDKWNVERGITDKDGNLLRLWQESDGDNPNCENSNNPNEDAKPHLRKVVVLFSSHELS